MEARILMKLYDFSKYPQKFQVVVRAGDFSKNHSGDHQPPDDLLAALQNFSHADFNRCCKDCSALLQQIHNKEAQFREAAKQNPLPELIILTIAQLDILHSFFHGGAVVAQIWQMQKLSTDPIFNGIALEGDFADTIALLGRAGLTGKLAYRAIHASERAKNFAELYNKKLAWLDIIEDPQPAN
jgi:hypothetical protein